MIVEVAPDVARIARWRLREIERANPGWSAWLVAQPDAARVARLHAHTLPRGTEADEGFAQVFLHEARAVALGQATVPR